MADNNEKLDVQNARRPFEPAMREAAELLLGSIWNDRVVPAKDAFTAKVARMFGQKAGCDTFARLHNADPEMDAAYDNIIV